MDPEALLTLDEELLAIMLENMSYSDIMDWCNAHPRFKDLCSTSELVTSILHRKGQEEVVAIVTLHSYDPESVFFSFTLVSDFFNANDNFLLTREDLKDLLGKLYDQEPFDIPTQAWVYAAGFTETIEEVGVTYTYNPDRDTFIGILSARCPSLSVDPVIFQSVLEAVASTAEKGLTADDGRVFVFRDGSTRFKSSRRR